MIIELIRIKNYLLKALRKFLKFKEILEGWKIKQKHWLNKKQFVLIVNIRLLFVK